MRKNLRNCITIINKLLKNDVDRKVIVMTAAIINDNIIGEQKAEANGSLILAINFRNSNV